MSENSDDLPPARARPRPAGRDTQDQQQQRGAAHADRTRPREQPAVRGPDDDEEIEVPIRSAFRLADYVSSVEDRDMLAQLKEQLELDLSPQDFVERLWIDEIVIVEWEAHRLRSAKKVCLEKGMALAMGEHWVAKNGVPGSPEDRYAYREIPAAIAGDIASRAILNVRLEKDHFRGGSTLPASGYLQEVNRQLDLERAILACGHRRDAILNRLYGRRELLESKAAKAGPLPSR